MQAGSLVLDVCFADSSLVAKDTEAGSGWGMNRLVPWYVVVAPASNFDRAVAFGQLACLP